MDNNRTKFVTCIYSDLYGTDLGGRPSRAYHYRYSLLSLLKMTNAKFVCYTSEHELESLYQFFYYTNVITTDQLTFVTCDLRKTKYSSILSKIKNIEQVKVGDRCVELQYSKLIWVSEQLYDCDYCYWIDAGLSHSGLLPLKHLPNGDRIRQYFESPLFNNNIIANLNWIAKDHFFIMSIDNNNCSFSQTADRKWYNHYDWSNHIIGGLFGGQCSQWPIVAALFDQTLIQILITDKQIYSEEQILSVIYCNHRDLFTALKFDTFWCTDSRPDIDPTFFNDKISFYQLIEQLSAPLV